MGPSLSDPLEDPIIRAQVDRAVAPYREKLSAEAIEEMRNVLAVQLASHPVLSRMVQRVRPPPVVHRSDDILKEGEAAPDDAKTSTGTGGDD